MIGTTTISREVESFIFMRFGFEPLESSTDELDDNELMFSCGDSDCEEVGKILREHFSGYGFHTTCISGMLAILIESSN